MMVQVDGGDATRVALEALISADLRAMTAQSNRIGRTFATSQDVTPNDFHALLHIMVAETAGTPLTSGDLCERLGVSGAAVTYLVARMVAAGHIRRERDSADRRKVLLRYEPGGMELARSFFAPLGAHMRTAMADLTNADLESAHRVFGVLIDTMRVFGENLAESRQPSLRRDG